MDSVFIKEKIIETIPKVASSLRVNETKNKEIAILFVGNRKDGPIQNEYDAELGAEEIIKKAIKFILRHLKN